MKPIEPHVLENETWQVGLLPSTGMSTAFGRVKHPPSGARATGPRPSGAFLDFLRPTPQAAYDKSSDCSSYLLIPWSNRIKDGRFAFRGKEHRLKVNAGDGSAIHGMARDYPWQVEHSDRQRLVARFDSRNHEESIFPFAFSARAEFRLEAARFIATISAKNEDTQPMPAGLGHHPYFQRAIASEGDNVRLEIPCAEYFELEASIPSGAPVAVDSRLDFRAKRPLDPDAKLDDCLTGRIAGAPIRFAYPESGLALSLELDPIFENVVIYVPPRKTYFAVEPVTNANDGFNLYDRGIRGSGVFVLEPGEERAASIAFRVET
jgi:aldose 1-epimerase